MSRSREKSEKMKALPASRIDAHRHDFFSRLREFKDDPSGESLYRDPERRTAHELSLPYLESLPLNFETIVDVGCGCGYDSQWLVGKGKQVTALTSNVTPAQVAFARANGFDMVNMDMNALEFQDESLDAVLCKHSLEHSFSPIGALYEFFRVLKPGGFLFIVVPPHHAEIIESGHFTQGWCIGQLAYLLAVTGFDTADGAFRARPENVEAVVRRAENMPVGRGLYDLKDRMPPPIRAIMRDDSHGAFARERFSEINWPYNGERQTRPSGGPSAGRPLNYDQIPFWSLFKHKLQRKGPLGKWVAKRLRD